MEPTGGQFTHPTFVWLWRLGTETCDLTVEEERLQIFLEECFIVQTAVPALASIGTGEDVSLPSVYENGDINYVTEVYKANNDVGYVFLVVGDGFGGKGTMKIMTSMDSDGKIIQTKTLEHKETPGLGSKTTSDDFRSQFVGVDISTLDDCVDAITGATRSSEYYFDSVRSAFDAFQLIAG